MCGIFGYIGPRSDAAKLVLEGLKRLEYRGYDSWGVAVVPQAQTKSQKSKILVKKKAGKIGSATVGDMPTGSLGFGHTRWATHGGVTDANAHPHLDCSGTIAIIHNGILENYESLKKRLVGLGHRFVSATDTEVAVHLIEEYAKTTMLSKAVQKAFNEMEGLNAFIVINSKDRQMVAVRNGSPLVVGYGAKENYLASDAAALLPHTRQVHFLEDDEMAIVNPDEVLLFNARDGSRHQPKKQTLTWSIAQAEKGTYPTFMLKEIHEQPGLIADIAASNFSQAQKLAAYIRSASNTFIVGCGTASYAAIAAQYLFSKIAKAHVNPIIGSEFTYAQDFLTKKSLVIALSQSGETIDTLEAIRKAKIRGASIATIVNVLGSSLYREADFKMLIGAGPEKAVASTKAFIGKLSHLILVAYALVDKISTGQKVLTLAAKSTKAVLAAATASKIQRLAKKMHGSRHVYVIGRGLSYPASLETALKIKEISYIHAEGLAAGELKHGPLALVEKGTPCIVFAPSDETFGANLAGAV